MRVISEVLLRTMHSEIKESLNINSTISDYHYGKLSALSDAIGECRELQEPWMTLEEFLKSGFVGQCWVHAMNSEILIAYFSEQEFIWALGGLDKDKLTHVMPIHKPEPPR